MRTARQDFFMRIACARGEGASIVDAVRTAADKSGFADGPVVLRYILDGHSYIWAIEKITSPDEDEMIHRVKGLLGMGGGRRERA